jgi:glucokinase
MHAVASPCYNCRVIELALGVDIGGTKILIALVTSGGAVLRQWRFPTDAARGGPAVMAAVSEALLSILAELPEDERLRLNGIGVCAAGQIDWHRGCVTYASPNIPGWSGTPIRDELAALTGLPITVDNDGNAAAFGEFWAGAGRGAGDQIMVTVGTGIGGGIVLDGEVLRGGRFRGGEIGHMMLVANGEPCNCGQRGCLEVYASGTAIARVARERIAGWHDGTPAVFAAARVGNAMAESVIASCTRSLAQGLVSLANVLDPNLFLLGGGVATQQGFLQRIRETLADPTVVGDRGFDPESVRLATLGETAGVVGAAGQLLRSRKVSLELTRSDL